MDAHLTTMVPSVIALGARVRTLAAEPSRNAAVVASLFDKELPRFRQLVLAAPEDDPRRSVLLALLDATERCLLSCRDVSDSVEGLTALLAEADTLETAGASSTPLEICIGRAPGMSLDVRSATALVKAERLDANVTRGEIHGWKRVVVRTTRDGGSTRAFVLEPAADEDALTYGQFYVRGHFAVISKAGSTSRADEIWQTITPR